MRDGRRKSNKLSRKLYVCKGGKRVRGAGKTGGSGNLAEKLHVANRYSSEKS